MGLSSAAGYWIGQAIGKGDIKEAKEFFKISTAIAVVQAFLGSFLLLLFMSRLTRIYTTNESVIAMCEKVGWLAAIGAFADHLGGFLQGPIKALGI